MPKTAFDEMSCSIARTLAVIGETWTPLIVRDLFIGLSRFDAIQRDLGISRKVLAERLAVLREQGVIERLPYQDNPPRYDYRLTEKGRDLAAVLVAMKGWGDRWAAGESGPPLLFRHQRCGQIGDPVPVCSSCGEPLAPEELTPVLGPGYEAGPGTREVLGALARLHAD